MLDPLPLLSFAEELERIVGWKDRAPNALLGTDRMEFDRLSGCSMWEGRKEG